MGFNANKTLTINPNKTLNVTQTVLDTVTATFSVDPTANPNSFPAQKVLRNVDLVISPGEPVKDGQVFTGWSPSLPRTISEDTVFTATFGTATTTTAPPAAKTLTPSTAVGAVTASSVSFNITNNDSATATVSWVIRLGAIDGTPATSGSQSVAGNSTITVSATGLSPDTNYYLTDVFATVPGLNQSNQGATRVATTSSLPVTAAPETAVHAVATDSVTFRIRNIDTATATITWLIRLGTQTGTIVGSDTVNNVAFNTDIFASLTGLSSGQTYWLTDVKATASGKVQSAEAIRRSITTSTTTTTTTTTTPPPATATPSFSNISRTTNSISFRANNNDSSSVSMAVSNNSTGQFLFTGTVSGNSFTTINNSGLSQNTTYQYQITATASGKTQSSATTNISTLATTTTTTTTTQAPPPPPPTTTTTAAPTTTTTTTTSSPVTANPTVNLSNSGGRLGVSIINNDSSTVSLSYSGSALSVVSGLPSSLSAGQSFFNTYFVFGGETYQLCATATASGKASSGTVCDSQSM